MKKTIIRLTLMLLLMAGFGASAVAQYRHSGHYHTSYRPSRTHRILETLDAVEHVADYAMMGAMLSRIDDYTGIRIGYNSASLHASGFDDTPADDIPAFNLGIVFGWYLGHSNFSLEPGVFYSMKGGHLNEYLTAGGRDFSSTKYTMHSFEVPLVVKAHLPLGPGASLQPFAGAFMSFGFAGTTTANNGEKYDTFDDRILEDFDAGFRLGSGLSVGNLYFEAAYDLGLLNLCEPYSFDRREALRSRTWSFNIGLNF